MPAPRSLCILRLSALGDVTHVLPVVHSLQQAWPGVHITWVIGRLEHRLLQQVQGVDFVEYDKRSGVAGMRAVRQTLQSQLRVQGQTRFDVLLQMQVAARANVLSAFIPAHIRVGFDRERARDLHGLFINRRIAARPGIHVLDALHSFVEPLGLTPGPVHWDVPIGADAHAWAQAQWPQDGQPTLIISPCSSPAHAQRTWRAERYAAVAQHAHARGWRVVLCGGRSAFERQMGDAILAHTTGAPVLDLIGQDSLPQLPALLARGDLIMTPDSGPMHVANAVGRPVLGLHAASNPRRSGPYSSLRYCVDKYDQAARRYLNQPADALRWGTKIEREGVMDLIEVADAIAAFERYVADAEAGRVAPAL